MFWWKRIFMEKMLVAWFLLDISIGSPRSLQCHCQWFEDLDAERFTSPRLSAKITTSGGIRKEMLRTVNLPLCGTFTRGCGKIPGVGLVFVFAAWMLRENSPEKSRAFFFIIRYARRNVVISNPWHARWLNQARRINENSTRTFVVDLWETRRSIIRKRNSVTQ